MDEKAECWICIFAVGTYLCSNTRNIILVDRWFVGNSRFYDRAVQFQERQLSQFQFDETNNTSADQSTTTSEHGGTEKVSPCLAITKIF